MSYLKINNTDYSLCVNSLNITKTTTYNSQTNAAGDMIVDLIGAKRVFEVGIIPLDDIQMKNLLKDIDGVEVSLSFRNPLTNELEENVACIIPENTVEYYTIQQNKVMYKTFTLSFIEL